MLFRPYAPTHKCIPVSFENSDLAGSESEHLEPANPDSESLETEGLGSRLVCSVLEQLAPASWVLVRLGLASLTPERSAPERSAPGRLVRERSLLGRLVRERSLLGRLARENPHLAPSMAAGSAAGYSQAEGLQPQAF
jgi:hypothetical protein